MAQEYPGFLTESQRKYLRGERDITEHSNPSVVRARIRERVSGSLRDLQLVKNAEWMNGENLAKTIYGNNISQVGRHGISDEQVKQGQDVAEGVAQLYGSEFVENLTEQLEELEVEADGIETADDMEGFVQELFISNSIAVMIDALRSYGLNEKTVIRDFISNVWPDRDKALDITETVLESR